MSSYIPDSVLKRIKELESNVNKLNAQLIFMPSINSTPISFSNPGSRNAAHGPLTGLEVLPPVPHFLTGASHDQITISASNIIVDQVGATTLNLKTILGTPNDGVSVRALSVKAGKTLTLKTGGNLAITADIALTDSDIAYLVYSQDLGNKYRVITSKGSSGGGSLWSAITIDVTKDMLGFSLENLGHVTFVNSDGKLREIAGVIGTGMTFDLGTSVSPISSSEQFKWSKNSAEILSLDQTGLRLFVDQDFNQHKAVNITEIDWYSTGSTMNIIGHNDGTQVDFTINGNTAFHFINNNALESRTVLEILGNGVSANTVPAIKTYSTPLTVANNNQIGAFSFDSYNSANVRKTYAQLLGTSRVTTANLENGEFDIALLHNALLYTAFQFYNSGLGTTFVIQGVAGSPLLINKASGTPAIYTATDGHQFDSTIFPGTVGGVDIGSSGAYFRSMYGREFRMPVGVAGAIDTSRAMITANGSNDMIISVPTTSSMRFYFNNVDKWDISSSQLTGPNIILGNILTINNGGADPSANGQLGRSSNDLKVFTGGVLKNFTQMPQLNGANIWPSSNQFTLGLSINATTFIILNQNDSGDTGIRQSTGVGTVPKHLDLECFADVVFQGVGENSTALSRGLVKGMQQAGDPTTAQIPSGYGGFNKNTSTGAVKIWYNDGGVMKSATLS